VEILKLKHRITSDRDFWGRINKKGKEAIRSIKPEREREQRQKEEIRKYLVVYYPSQFICVAGQLPFSRCVCVSMAAAAQNFSQFFSLSPTRLRFCLNSINFAPRQWHSAFAGRALIESHNIAFMS
jgi:hypothetical protein